AGAAARRRGRAARAAGTAAGVGAISDEGISTISCTRSRPFRVNNRKKQGKQTEIPSPRPLPPTLEGTYDRLRALPGSVILRTRSRRTHLSETERPEKMGRLLRSTHPAHRSNRISHKGAGKRQGAAAARARIAANPGCRRSAKFLASRATATPSPGAHETKRHETS